MLKWQYSNDNNTNLPRLSLSSSKPREKTTLQTGYYFFHWKPYNQGHN